MCRFYSMNSNALICSFCLSNKIYSLKQNTIPIFFLSFCLTNTNRLPDLKPESHQNIPYQFLWPWTSNIRKYLVVSFLWSKQKKIPIRDDLHQLRTIIVWAVYFSCNTITKKFSRKSYYTKPKVWYSQQRDCSHFL